MVERRSEVVQRLKSLEELAAPLISFLQNPQLVQELRSDKQYNLQMLQERYKVSHVSPYPTPVFWHISLILWSSLRSTPLGFFSISAFRPFFREFERKSNSCKLIWVFAAF